MHIMTHIQELVCKSQTGGLLRLSAEAFRVELGVPFTLGSTPSKRYSHYIPDCWYKSLWLFVEAHPVEIVEDYPSLPTLRVGDKFLMKCFMESGYSGADLKKLNYVRKFLKVVTVADIATSDGKRISHEAYLCQCGNGLRNDIEWPRVPSTLPRPFITLWKTALREIFIIPYANENNRRLVRELGPWTDSSVTDKWIWYFDEEENRVYQRSIDGWQMYFSA